MVDVALSSWLYHLIVFCILVAFIILFNIIFVAKFQDSEEAGHAYIAKIVTIVAFTFAFASILMLPFDIALKPVNALFMPIVWEVFMGASAVLCFFVLPFFICVYENSDENCGKRICCGFCGGLTTAFVFCGICAGVWAVAGYANVPMRELTSAALPMNTTCSTAEWAIKLDLSDVKGFESPHRVYIQTRMSVTVYAIALISLIGWVLLVVFGGCGLFSLPIDLMLDFAYRPRKLTVDKFCKLKTELSDNVKTFQRDLATFEQQAAASRSAKERRKLANMYRELQTRVGELEADAAKLTLHEHPDYNPFIPWIELVVGIFGIVISVAWWIHVLLYLAWFQISPFLNAAFTALDNAFPYLGIAFYGVFVFYLLWCVVKGAIKVGLKIFFLPVHPLVLHGTFMNSFLFNAIIVLMATFALLQFATNAFRSYAANTSVKALFGSQIQNMWGLSYFWDYVPYIFLGFSVLGLFWSLVVTARKVSSTRKKQEKSIELKTTRTSSIPTNV